MVFRAFLAFWLLVTSTFAPAFCCCVPSASAANAQADKGSLAKSAVRVRTHCPHCNPFAVGKKEAPNGNSHSNCPAKSNNERCPCEDHVLVSVVPSDVEVGKAIFANWLPDFASIINGPIDHVVLVQNDSRIANYTGPPPLGGTALLRHLHVLIC